MSSIKNLSALKKKGTVWHAVNGFVFSFENNGRPSYNLAFMSLNGYRYLYFINKAVAEGEDRNTVNFHQVFACAEDEDDENCSISQLFDHNNKKRSEKKNLSSFYLQYLGTKCQASGLSDCTFIQLVIGEGGINKITRFEPSCIIPSGILNLLCYA